MTKFKDAKAAFRVGYNDATTGRGEYDEPDRDDEFAEDYAEGFNEGQLYLEDMRCEALELGDA